MAFASQMVKEEMQSKAWPSLPSKELELVTCIFQDDIFGSFSSQIDFELRPNEVTSCALIGSCSRASQWQSQP